MYDFHENIEEYNLNKEHEILIVFDDMTADMSSNKRHNLIVTNYLSEVENSAFLLFLLQNVILMYQKIFIEY